jgi:hypothetical protein
LSKQSNPWIFPEVHRDQLRLGVGLVERLPGPRQLHLLDHVRRDDRDPLALQPLLAHLFLLCVRSERLVAYPCAPGRNTTPEEVESALPADVRRTA